MQQVEGWIAAEVEAHHPEVLLLATIPGVGLVLAAGIIAEIGDLAAFLPDSEMGQETQTLSPQDLARGRRCRRQAGWPVVAARQLRRFVAEDRHLAKTGNRYLRYYLVQAANGMRRHIPAYARFYASNSVKPPITSTSGLWSLRLVRCRSLCGSATPQGSLPLQGGLSLPFAGHPSPYSRRLSFYCCLFFLR